MELTNLSKTTRQLEQHESSNKNGSNAYSEALERISQSPLRSLLLARKNEN